MFGISFAELGVVMLVALLVFGPEKLPEIASKIGKLSFQLRRASDGFRREFYNSVYTPAQEHKEQLKNELLSAKEEVLGLRSEAPKKEAFSYPTEKSSPSNQVAESIDEVVSVQNEPEKIQSSKT